MPYATIGDLKVYYEMHGQGETVILLHHGFGCTKIWKDIYPALVEAGYRVVLYDRRGYGKSERGEAYLEFYVSERFRAESVKELAALKGELGIGPCHLVGQCEGGVVAADYAARYPSQIRSLVTSSTQCFSTVPMTELNAMKFTKAFADLHPEQQEKFIDWHGEDTEALFNQFRLFGGLTGRTSLIFATRCEPSRARPLFCIRTEALSSRWSRALPFTDTSCSESSWCCLTAATTPTRNGPRTTSGPSWNS
jgi:pimeloyl-ACP methyl ester carboxylesterase